jgi:hypothetical protein
MERRPFRASRPVPARSGPRAPPAGAAAQRPTGVGNQQAQRLMQSITRGDARVGRHDDAAERQGGSAATVRPRAPTGTSVIEQALGAGRALDPGEQARGERRLGVPLGDVRVHDDESAATSAATLGTRAFTDGRHIAFGPGQYRPGDAGSGSALDHELGHVARGDAAGNMLRRDPIGPQIPAQVTPVAAGVSFDLPGGKELTGAWNDLSTVNPTTVTLTVRTTGIDLSFSPALCIDAQWPVSDMDWSGLHYDFVTASVTSIDLVSTQDAAFSGGQGTARSDITTFFVGLLAGSNMATAGYDPLADPDLPGTLARIRANFTAMPSSGGEVGAADVSHVSLFGDATVHGPVSAGAGDGSVSIDGAVHVSAELRGTGADLAQGATAGRSPQIERLTLSGSSIIVHSGTDEVARLDTIVVAFGGQVSIERMTLLGRAAEMAGAESGVRLLGLLLVLGEGTSSDRLALAGRDLPDLNAQLVPGISRALIEQALSRAVVQFIRQNSGLLPGLDLTEIFGTGTLGDFPTVPPAGPGTALG